MNNEQNYYVFRIAYDNNFYKLKDEVDKGRLHQGWGKSGMSILNDFQFFYNNWPKEWSDNEQTIEENKAIKRKYNQLCIMTEFKENDIIIVPKIPKNDQFMILKVKDSYYFDESIDFFDKSGDFRHTIPVEILRIVSYNHSNDSRIISQKFRSYQACINHVWNSNFKEAVTNILQSKESDYTSSKNELMAIDFFIGHEFDNFSNVIKEKITQWAPHRLEKIVRELFEKNGFECIKSNSYDKQGGDIDLIFTIPTDNILGNIIELSNKSFNIETKPLPEIHVQVKKKTGTDDNAKDGIVQLINMKNETEQSVDILINTTDNFNENDIKYANENGILLISWSEFVKLLIKYGCII